MLGPIKYKILNFYKIQFVIKESRIYIAYLTDSFFELLLASSSSNKTHIFKLPQIIVSSLFFLFFTYLKVKYSPLLCEASDIAADNTSDDIPYFIDKIPEKVRIEIITDIVCFVLMLCFMFFLTYIAGLISPTLALTMTNEYSKKFVDVHYENLRKLALQDDPFNPFN